jgi:SAM-dependent methyltransferase
MTYENVFLYYKVRFREVSHGDILKTDCYNEAFGRPIVELTLDRPYLTATLIEFDPVHIEKAKLADPTLNIIQGDIRDLSDLGLFDVIFDFSTIDHIPEEDTKKVFAEYHKHLKEDGELLMFVWFGDAVWHKGDWDSTHQYFFNQDNFMKNMVKYFKVLESKVIMDDQSPECPKGGYLYEILAKRK